MTNPDTQGARCSQCGRPAVWRSGLYAYCYDDLLYTCRITKATPAGLPDELLKRILEDMKK